MMIGVLSKLFRKQTMSKTEIAIVYGPQEGPIAKIYENDKAIVYTSKTKQSNMINVGMGWYSIPNPTPEDSILVLEPYCVLERDYDYTYVGQYKHIFSWTPRAFAHPAFANKIVEINHPCCKDPPNPDVMVENWLPWDQRSNEVVFIANNKMSRHESELYSLRLELADHFHAQGKFTVSWYGQSPVPKPYYKGQIEHKSEILGKVKFSVCNENCYDPIYSHNYFTEKMPEVWFAGAVPLYMGCFNINNFNFSPHSYFDLRTYVQGKRGNFNIDMNALTQRMLSFDAAQYENFKNDVKHNIKKENGLYHIISYDRVYEKIINTLC